VRQPEQRAEPATVHQSLQAAAFARSGLPIKPDKRTAAEQVFGVGHQVHDITGRPLEQAEKSLSPDEQVAAAVGRDVGAITGGGIRGEAAAAAARQKMLEHLKEKRTKK
jgi:hypothetical protein